MQITPQQFFAKYNGKPLDWDGRYGSQCVDQFRFYCRDVWGIAGNTVSTQPSGGAKDLWTNAKSPIIKISPKEMIEGDAPIWNSTKGEGYGHVGTFVKWLNNEKTRFQSFDQNWGKQVCQFVEHDLSGLIGALRMRLIQTAGEGIDDVFVTANVLNVRKQPRVDAPFVDWNVGGGNTVKSYQLKKGDEVNNCDIVKGDVIDGYNGWFKSARGGYFTSRWTNMPTNL